MDITHLSILPRELQLTILEFYYKKQSKELCEDIRSFILTRDILIKNYKAYWYDYSDETHLDWLANDMTAYMNNFVSTIDGYTPNHNALWRRLFLLKDKSDDYIYNTTLLAEMKMPVIQDIYIRIGLMTPKERIECLKYLSEI